MKIGIIGAGQIGGTLTRRLTKLGHTVFVANSRGPETLAELAKETGAKAVPVKEAVRGVDLVVVTIPEKNIPKLPAGLFADVTRRSSSSTPAITIRGSATAASTGSSRALPESRWVAQQLGRPVIKAFNNIYARHLLELGKPRGTPKRIALPVAGDDSDAKDVVMRLVDELGFDAVDAGRSRRVLAAAAVHPGLRDGPRRRGNAKCARRGEAGNARPSGVPRRRVPAASPHLPDG